MDAEQRLIADAGVEHGHRLTVNQAASSMQNVKTSHSLASGQAKRGRMLAGISAAVTAAAAAKDAKPAPTEIACKQHMWRSESKTYLDGPEP